MFIVDVHRRGMLAHHEDPGSRTRGVRAAAERPGDRPRGARRRRGPGAAGRLRRVPHRPLHRLRRRPVRVCTDRARTRGRGRGGAGRRGRDLLAPGDHVVTLFSPQCGECIHCRARGRTCAWRSATSRTRATCRTAPPACPATASRSATSWGRHVRGVHGDAGDRARQGQPGGAAGGRRAVRLRALDRARRGAQHRQGRARLDVRRVRRRHGRPRRGRRLPPGRRGADHRRRPVRGPARLARGQGATDTRVGDEDTVERILDETGGFGADYTFEATGNVR